MTGAERFGRLSSMEDVELAPPPEDRREPEKAFPGLGNALWSYRNEHRINGVPVAEGDTELKITSDDILLSAFVLDRRPMSAVLYVAPGSEGSEQYDALLARAYAGEIVIVDEIKQFDAANARFVVWVRYDEVRYVLHPRYKYLREE